MTVSHTSTAIPAVSKAVRSTVITGLTLPIAVISSFIAVYLFGFTLNFMTMMALSLCIGLLIDDAIVVRENIVRHVHMGKGHREAAQVLGLSPLQSFRRIVLPQAVRMTLPPLASNFVQLIKFSSLGAVISVSEITRRGMELSATNFRPLETFTFIAVVYFFICWPLAMAIRWWERRLRNR